MDDRVPERRDSHASCSHGLSSEPTKVRIWANTGSKKFDVLDEGELSRRSGKPWNISVDHVAATGLRRRDTGVHPRRQEVRTMTSRDCLSARSWMEETRSCLVSTNRTSKTKARVQGVRRAGGKACSWWSDERREGVSSSLRDQSEVSFEKGRVRGEDPRREAQDEEFGDLEKCPNMILVHRASMREASTK